MIRGHYKRSDCRLCGSKVLTKVLSMGSSQPVDNYRKPLDESLSLPQYPYDLYLCNDCKHVQLLDVVNPSILYENYIYTSSSSTDLEEHFEKYANWLIQNSYLTNGSKILDIGANDGLFLSNFLDSGISCIGIDPSGITTIDSNISIIKSYMDEVGSEKLLNISKEFDVITANNVFSHQDNISEMLEQITRFMGKSSWFVFEVSYLKSTIDNKVYDYIYHEHLSYHSITALVPFLKNHGLYISDVKEINTKGGSIRVVTSKNKHLEDTDVILRYIREETVYGKPSTFNDLARLNEQVSHDIISIINSMSNHELSIIGYGASATSTVLTEKLGIGDLLSFVVDDNIQRQKCLSPNNYLPIHDINNIRSVKGKIIVIILAWRFSVDIIQKLRSLDKEITVVVPLPNPRIVQL